MVEEHGTRGNLPPLWVCPNCGARLVSRNLWHSCVQLTLDELFATSDPPTRAGPNLRLDAALTWRCPGDTSKDAAGLRCQGAVQWTVGAKDGFLANFSLHRWLDSPRIVKTADYGPRWRSHNVLVQSPMDLDDELKS